MAEETKAAGERVREFTESGIRRAAEGYEQISKVAQSASAEVNTQFGHAREGATKVGLKLLDAAQHDVDAGLAACRDLLSATSPMEAVGVTAKYWRGRLVHRLTLAQELGSVALKAADEAVRPVQERIVKFTKRG